MGYIIFYESRKLGIAKAKRPEKLPFSNVDISTMNEKQFSKLGLRPIEVVDYMSRDVEREKTKAISQKVDEVVKEEPFVFKRRFEPPRPEIRPESKAKESTSQVKHLNSVFSKTDFEKFMQSKPETQNSFVSSSQSYTPSLNSNFVFKVPELAKLHDLDPATLESNERTQVGRTLAHFGITSSAINVYAQNLRHWVHEKILKQVLTHLENTNREMAKHQLQAYDCTQVLDSVPKYEYLIPKNMAPPVSGRVTFRSVLHFVGKDEKDQTRMVILSNRLHIEEYLDIPNCDRSYLLSRMRQLAEGAYLQRFEWNSGSSHNGEQWNERDFPTDARIIFHLFCKFFDMLLPKSHYYGFSTFSQRYVVDHTHGKSDDAFGYPCIVRKKKFPPHFNVQTTMEHDVESGRNNLFHSLALFLLAIHKQQDGMIESVSLTDKTVGLGRIFRE